MSEENSERPNQTNGIIIAVILLVVVVIIWSLLRAYTTNGLKAYNDCYNTSNYSVFDAVNGFKNPCDSKRPADFLIWLTGAS